MDVKRNAVLMLTVTTTTHLILTANLTVTNTCALSATLKYLALKLPQSCLFSTPMPITTLMLGNQLLRRRWKRVADAYCWSNRHRESGGKHTSL